MISLGDNIAGTREQRKPIFRKSLSNPSDNPTMKYIVLYDFCARSRLLDPDIAMSNISVSKGCRSDTSCMSRPILKSAFGKMNV